MRKMNLREGDSVVIDGKRDLVGIVGGRNGSILRVRLAGESSESPFEIRNIERSGLSSVAAEIARTLEETGNSFGALKLSGGSTLSDLVRAFGYRAEYRLRSGTLSRIREQLERAGVELKNDEGARESQFEVRLVEVCGEASPAARPKPTNADVVQLPAPFWPQVFGLPTEDLLRFLRSLMDAPPILCLLKLEEGLPHWIKPVWEGMTSWAYHHAQAFVRQTAEVPRPRVVAGPPSLLEHFQRGSLLDDQNGASLQDSAHSLNLLAGEHVPEDSELRTVTARWPGPIFRFTPTRKASGDESTASSEQTALTRLLALVGGWTSPDDERLDEDPLQWLAWARQSADQILAAAGARVGRMIADAGPERFRGSNEGSDVLAMKLLAVAGDRRSKFDFEVTKEEEEDDNEDAPRRVRIDVLVEGGSCSGKYEIESLRGSGPIEAFYHKKIFSRLQRRGKSDVLFHLVVPSHSLLWLGPYLADIACHLRSRGSVVFPCSRMNGSSGTDGLYLQALEARELGPELLTPEAFEASPEAHQQEAEARITLADIGGYDAIKALINRDILLFRDDPSLAQTDSRAGILLYGPPGCGKSRIAHAIAGTMGGKSRLVLPSDVRGPYIGWGQIMIRDQFEWLYGAPDRVLIFDEFDSIARSRHQGEMHSDEKANVNELLMHLEKAARLGRLVICTTNDVESLDEAVLRPGRIGQFVPVGPPEAKDAYEIVKHWLRKLGKDLGSGKTVVVVELPGDDDVKSLIAEHVGRDTGGPRLSGADLREVVFAAYRAAYRIAQAPDAARPRAIRVTGALMADAFRSARRSVTMDAMKRFSEVKRQHGTDDSRAVPARDKQ